MAKFGCAIADWSERNAIVVRSRISASSAVIAALALPLALGASPTIVAIQVVGLVCVAGFI